MVRKARWLLALITLAMTIAPSPDGAHAIGEADRLWLVGERALQDGLPEVSRRALERLIERFPQDARVREATLLLGKARLAEGSYAGALEAFKKAQSFSPPAGKPEEARFWEGETLLRMKKPAEARAIFDRLLTENPASPFAPEALYGFGWAELNLGRRESAVSSFQRVVNTFPDHALAPSATVQLARTLLELKRSGEAIPLLRAFPEKYPDNRLLPDARYLLGYARIASGQNAEGVADLRAFVAAYPAHELTPQARRLTLDSLIREGKQKDLAQEYKELLAQSPATPEGLYDAGAIATRLGRPKDAEAAWSQLRSEFPDHAFAARASLELAQSAFARNAFKDAASLGRTAGKSGDAEVQGQALLLVGESELKLKRWAPAHEAFRGAVKAAGRNADVRYRALAGSGLALEEQGRWADAAGYYREVSEESPDRELRAWAKSRRSAVEAKLKPVAPAKPGPKPAPAKPGSGR